MDSNYIKSVLVTVLVGVVGLASYGVVRQIRDIGEGRIVMATGSSQYFELAESYRQDLERYGVQYEVQRRTEGFATLKALLEPDSGINAGFIKGGLVGSLQGRLATEKAKGRHVEYGKLLVDRPRCSTSRSGCSRAATCRSPACATSRARRS